MLEVGEERLNEWSQLEQGIMTRLSLLLVQSIIIEMKKFEDKCETIPLHDLKMESVFQGCVCILCSILSLCIYYVHLQ